MKSVCERYLEGLSDLAFGKDAPEALRHVSGCKPCAEKLEQLEAMARSFAALKYEAPKAVRQRAVAIMQPSAAGIGRTLEKFGQEIIAYLVGSTLTGAPTRSAASSAENFQLAFQASDMRIRLMYTREHTGWLVMGRVPENGCEAYAGNSHLKLDSEGGFRFRAKNLRETSLRIARGEDLILVPSAEEVFADDGGRDR